MGEFIKKAKTRHKLRVVGTSVQDPAWAKSYPALFDYMTSEKWDDKSPRKTTTLWLFCEGGQVKACVSDRESNESAFVTSDTFQGLLQAIEEGLVADSLQWRVKSDSGSFQRQKKRPGQTGRK